MFSPKIKQYHELPGDTTFSSIGATIADNFNVEMPEFGKSYLKRNGSGTRMKFLRWLLGISFGTAGVLHFTRERQFRNIVPDYLPLQKQQYL